MSVLSAKELHQRIFCEEGNKQLIITPLLDSDNQLDKNISAVDVRLGTHFVIQRRTNVSYIDIADEAKRETKQALLES